VGDSENVRPAPRGGRAVDQHVLPRRSRFSRQAAGRETEEQIVAANIDIVFLVFGLDKPVNRRSIERYLVVARRGGAEPMVVLNKADARDAEAAVADARLAAGDVPVHAVSARTGQGFEVLEACFGEGRTVALLGPSGAGKSSIVNRLIGRDLLATGEVRDWDRRGRHTSVHRQLLLRQQGGLVIDTPGMRELQLWDTEDDVDESFADIAGLAGGCRFRDCRHETEPGCAVKAAVEDGRLDSGRHESFLKLQAEQEAAEARREERALLESRRKGRPRR
jgi:ribosome biogenesis GTPase